VNSSTVTILFLRRWAIRDEEISRPLIGVVNAANEIIPDHIHLNMIAADVKAGIRMSGRDPGDFPPSGSATELPWGIAA
jgi:dihydroxy-acid dehydratase